MAGGSHAILRTSWVFSATGTNFVKTMLRLGAERDSLSIVADQIGGPTCADDIAVTLLKLAKSFAAGTAQSGIYHYAGAPDRSWADFATEIFKRASMDCHVEPIPTSAYPTPAPRPLNGRLDCSTLETEFCIQRPNWHASLTQVLKELS